MSIHNAMQKYSDPPVNHPNEEAKLFSLDHPAKPTQFTGEDGWLQSIKVVNFLNLDVETDPNS